MESLEYSVNLEPCFIFKIKDFSKYNRIITKVVQSNLEGKGPLIIFDILVPHRFKYILRNYFNSYYFALSEFYFKQLLHRKLYTELFLSKCTRSLKNLRQANQYI